MKRLFGLLALLLPLSLAAQQVTGSWNGTLDVGGTKLRLVFHIAQSDTGLKATLDSPDQGVKGIPVDSVACSASGISLHITPLQARFDGVFFGSELLTGIFTQMGRSMSLCLKRGEAERAARPQEPKAPYPYRCEEISFESRENGLTLHGTLTLPEGEGRHPAVVLVTGSGTQNRDEELMGHRPFLVLADRLTRAGYAVLRYDDRGWGATKEEAAALRYSTTHHLMLDALGGFDHLTNHPSIDPAKIIVAGHSEGGTIALLAAAEEPRVAGVISLAGMMVRGDEVLIKQNVVGLIQRGVPTEVAEAYGAALGRLYGYWQMMTPAELKEQQEAILGRAIGSEPMPEPLRKNLASVAESAQNPWFYHFVRLDPREAIGKLGKRPCLAINGEKDTQVDAAMNLGRLQALTTKNKRVTTKSYEGLNHLLQPCQTGAVTEYSQITTTIDEEVLSELIVWLDKQFK